MFLLSPFLTSYNGHIGNKKAKVWNCVPLLFNLCL
nr:MAG TPA: hypothetical protein [Caudoviricetes sp.]